MCLHIYSQKLALFRSNYIEFQWWVIMYFIIKYENIARLHKKKPTNLTRGTAREKKTVILYITFNRFYHVKYDMVG